jgi:hypothetical protein
LALVASQGDYACHWHCIPLFGCLFVDQAQGGTVGFRSYSRRKSVGDYGPVAIWFCRWDPALKIGIICVSKLFVCQLVLI